MAGFIHIVPYSLEGNLADAYNEAIDIVDSSVEWILCTDADIMLLTPSYGHLINEVIERHPEAGLITCTTNRIGAQSQLTSSGQMHTADLLELRKIALDRYRKFGSETSKIVAPVSGFFLLFRRSVWQTVGGFKGKGILHVDWAFSNAIAKLGLPIYRIEGLFAVHFYRLDGKSAC